MNKKNFFLLIAKSLKVLALFAVFSMHPRVFAGDLIQPGKCIGKICIGQTRKDVTSVFGAPLITRTLKNSSADEADIWIGSEKGGRQFLFVVYAKGSVVEVHASSSAFQTKSGISTACGFSDVKAGYPKGTESEYTLLFNGKNRYDWVVKELGITFSFAGDESGPMLVLAVYVPGQEKVVGYSDDEWYWYPSFKGKYVSFERPQLASCLSANGPR